MRLSISFYALIIFLFAFQAYGQNPDSVEMISLDSNRIETQAKEYTEYYPGSKNLKFKGMLNEEGRRVGLWTAYYQDGKILSRNEYLDNVLHGSTVVMYADGTINYRGKFENGKKLGLWMFYSEDGTLTFSKSYDGIE